LYQSLAERIHELKTWSAYVITSWPDFAVLGKRRPDRERKLYNGNIETHYYQFMGPKPPINEPTGTSR
jgi:putative N6-adenine-specific DNA methylase